MCSVRRKLFGTSSKGEDVYLYTLTNERGISVGILNLGGIIQSIVVPDRNGKCEDITPGFESVHDYESNPPYFGAIIGRVANRISEGKYTIKGKHYQASLNREHVCLHGGNEGFDKKCWDHNIKGNGLLLHYTSPAGEESFPGKLDVSLMYSLSSDNVLAIDLKATTDEETIVNLTNHAYFNLASHKADNIYDHMMTVNAELYLPKNEYATPTGELASVEGTPFDFRLEKNLGDTIHQVVENSVYGIDHCLCIKTLDESRYNNLVHGATLRHPGSGRVLEIVTNQPGIQIYTGNYLNGLCGKEDATYGQHSSVALETQFWPDAPNQPVFPSIALLPGETYYHYTEIKFLVEH